MRVSISLTLAGDKRRLRLKNSAPKSIIPFRKRNNAAMLGEAKSDLSDSSNKSPKIPAGIVPTIRSQPNFASVSSIRISLSLRDLKTPFIILIQSFLKKRKRTIAVAKWVATRNVKK